MATVESHHLNDDSSNSFRCLDEVPVGEVGVPRRGPVPPVTEQLPDQGQVLARYDGVTRRRMPQVMQAQPAEFCVRADRVPAGGEAVLSPPVRAVRVNGDYRASVAAQW